MPPLCSPAPPPPIYNTPSTSNPSASRITRKRLPLRSFFHSDEEEEVRFLEGELVAALMEPVSVEAGNAVAAEWLDLDDDGRPRHMGASAHIITAAIGSGVISLAWAIAHLGWVAGPTAMLLIAFVTYCIAQTICKFSIDSSLGLLRLRFLDS